MSGSLGPPPPPVSAVSSAATSHAQAVVGAAAAMSGASSSSQFQRLKVEDALSYLDQVKLQFGNQPQVYNDFLDIMKEFKSQSIDTPGVISRVSNLFRGHPDLIVGFNTFLPPGFKIEVRHNEINISGPAQHEQALQKIAAQHNSTTSAMNQSSMGTQSQQTSVATTTASQTSRGGAVPPHPPTVTAGTGSHTPHQPVEFNHAISYVNKIKNRFQQHPDIYKAFLEILHTYQKEQRVLKDGGTPTCVPLTETEVYSQVSKLFQNQEDLLKEFGQFLPDATSQFSLIPPPTKKQAVSAGTKSKPARKTSQSGVSAGGGQGKKAKSSAKDALAEAGKHTNYSELALFEKIRKALRNPEVYDNFLRCLILFNEEIISRQELVHLVTPFLGKYPELFMSLKVLLGFREPGLSDQLSTTTMTTVYMPKERVTADLAAEIDFNSLKRQGASYRALPKTYVQPKCSGRTQLCCEVLNDTWVSFPMWSEDSTFQGTRKTQFEEHIFRCEDERFELDIVLDTNLSTIRIFEALQKKFSRMTPDDLASFSLEDSLGGRSEVLQRKAIHRIYGDKAPDIIEGLKKSPAVALPIVLKRLKVKQEEWLEAQRSFNKLWREQLEKYYLKSLDYQGINFKALDTRSMRSKSLVCEIESVFDERQEQMVENFASSGPHLSFTFPSEQRVFADAVGLVMYYLKRASSMQRDDAVKIRSFLTQTLADFCYYDKVEVGVEDDLSPESGSDPMDVDDAPNDGVHRSSTANISGNLFPDTMAKFHMMDYHLMFTNNSVYTFFRLLHMLVERVGRIYCEAMGNICEEERSKSQREEGGEEEGETAAGGNVAINLGIKKSPDIQIDEYFPTFLNMAKNLMEGNIDSTTYEDTCREMFGVHAYVVFTIDRLVQNIVRQLHSMLSDEGSQVMEQFSVFVEQLSPVHISADQRLPLEMTYQRKIEGMLANENCFKLKFYKAGYKMTIELVDTDLSSEGLNSCSPSDVQRWLHYIQEYSKTDELPLPELKEALAKRNKLFLKRNRRVWPKLRSVRSPAHEDEARIIHTNLPKMEIHGSIQFKLDKNAYRMIPLANSEDYLYNRGSLRRQREGNSRSAGVKSRKFWAWHNANWRNRISEQDASECQRWLLSGEIHDEATPPKLRYSTSCSTEDILGQKRRRYITTVTPDNAL